MHITIDISVKVPLTQKMLGQRWQVASLLKWDLKMVLFYSQKELKKQQHICYQI